MNSKARAPSLVIKASPKRDKGIDKEKKTEMQGNGSVVIANGPNRCQSGRERKIALQQDVDKLRKKLRNEENIHRALERAFTRPLGALPRLPPYLPSHTLELLAEIAVLEEEVVRLEEQVVNFRQGLYQEAIYISSCKKTKELGYDVDSLSQNSKTLGQRKSYSNSAYTEDLAFTKQLTSLQWSSNTDRNVPSSNQFVDDKLSPKKLKSSLAITEKQQGKENQIGANCPRNCRQSPVRRASKVGTAANGNKQADARPKCNSVDNERTGINLRSNSSEAKLDESNAPSESESSGPSKLSEDILRCLMNIFSRLSSPGNTKELLEASPSVSGSSGSSEETDSLDPYGICAEFGIRDIGPYKYFRAVEASSNFPNLPMGCSFLTWRLNADVCSESLHQWIYQVSHISRRLHSGLTFIILA